MRKILFVCKGNICRSAFAHSLLEKKLKENNIQNVYVDSAGTGHWHIGKLPDIRTIREADRHQLPIRHLRSRQIQRSDFNNFDTIYTMDEENYSRVMDLMPSKNCSAVVEPITQFSNKNQKSITDPFHYSEQYFQKTYEQLDQITTTMLHVLWK